MKKNYIWYTLIVCMFMVLFSCATASKKVADTGDGTIFSEKYFFRPGADYYSFVDLKAIRPLMRDIIKQLPSAQRMQLQMLAGRTERILTYHLNQSTYSLFLGSYPKALLDSLLNMHPEWLGLSPEIDGYRHYDMNLEIGLPVSNIVYMTTSNLGEAYNAPTIPRESFLPPFVLQAIDQNAFTMYFPQGNKAFAKDNASFSDLPYFRMLMTMTPLDEKAYRIHVQFVFDTPAVAANFIPRLESMLRWYKSYYTGFADLIDLFQIDQQGKNVYLSSTLNAEQVAQISTEAVKTSMNTLMNKKNMTQEEVAL